MKKFNRFIDPLKWTSVLLLTAVMAACGSDSGGTSVSTAGTSTGLDLRTAGDFVMLSKTGITTVTDTAGMTLPVFTKLYAGDISGQTLAPGLYKWGTSVVIFTDVTLSGSSSDIWIFQIAGNLTQAAASSVKLTGGAVTSNVFWQVGGARASIGSTAHF